MSYASASTLDPETATVQQMITVLRQDLPKGWEIISQLAAKIKAGEAHSWARRDPNSEEGKQLIRLCGYDVPRGIIESHYGVKVGMLNCCKVVMTSTSEELRKHLTIAEQIREQNGEHASADC